MRICTVLLLVLFIASTLAASEFPSDTSSSQTFIFGIDIVDLEVAVVEHRNSKKRKEPADPAVIEITFDSNPFVTFAYTVDGIFELDWVVFNPGETATLFLPAGTYDLLAAWNPDDPGSGYENISIIEGLTLSGGTHEIHFQEADAEHVLEVFPFDPAGSPIPVELGTVLRSLRRTGCDLPVYRSQVGFASFNPTSTEIAGVFSTLSEAYSYESHFLMLNRLDRRGSPAYSYTASFRGGIDDDVVVTIDPQLWHDVTLRQYPEPWRESLLLTTSMANHPFADLPDDQLGLVRSSSCAGNQDEDENIDAPFEQQHFVLPNTDPDATIGFFAMGARAGSSCDHPGATLYRTPLIGWDDGIKGFLRGSSVPVYVPNSNSKVFPTGIGPYFWFARLGYEADKITITPSFGLDLLPFLSQTGCRPDKAWPSSTLACDLYRGDTLLESGFRTYIEGDGELVIPIEQPGEHSLVATSAPYWMNHIEGRSVATVRLGVDEDDPNPPYLTHFAVKADGEPVAHLLNNGGTVEFTAFDDGSGIANVTASYESFAGPKALTVVSEDNGDYRIGPIGSLNTGSETDFKIRIEDEGGNFLELSLLIPVALGMAPNNPSFVE